MKLPLIYRKGISAAQRRERIEKVLERLDMSHRIHHLPLSTVGRTVPACGHCPRHCWQAQIILADEPTGNLDSKMGTEVMAILHRLNKEDGITIIMVTHNEAQALETDRIVRFFDGRIIG